MITPSIATHALTRMYGSQTALDAVTLSVEPGSVYALVGPNGAGKTTLIQLIMNLQPATSGSAQLLGLPSSQIRGAASVSYTHLDVYKRQLLIRPSSEVTPDRNREFRERQTWPTRVASGCRSGAGRRQGNYSRRISRQR